MYELPKVDDLDMELLKKASEEFFWGFFTETASSIDKVLQHITNPKGGELANFFLSNVAGMFGTGHAPNCTIEKGTAMEAGFWIGISYVKLLNELRDLEELRRLEKL